MKKQFNPDDWAEPAAAQTPQNNHPAANQGADTDDDIEIVTQRIESARVDITQGYTNSRDLGFALSDALGENGRDYFHCISRFYSGYTEKETDDQYDKCMRAHGHGISVSVPSHTLFPSHDSFRQNGASRANSTSFLPNEGNEGDERSEGDPEPPLPTFVREIRDLLPEFFRKIVD